ncbi:hypothetical protein OUZ56_003136 [Daphnia magna]|uniref:Uncharacterized protein n=1 Tax=Daphnia magna TaxID=35525 RepID=A0ABR0A7U9_9CRUS|nr:hypothetical protein OUZ56_003136 [Daphnia magna]
MPDRGMAVARPAMSTPQVGPSSLTTDQTFHPAQLRASTPEYLYILFSSFNLLLLVPLLRRFSMRLQVLNVGLSFFLLFDSLAPFRAATICAEKLLSSLQTHASQGWVRWHGRDRWSPPSSSKTSSSPRVCRIKDVKAAGTAKASLT